MEFKSGRLANARIAHCAGCGGQKNLYTHHSTLLLLLLFCLSGIFTPAFATIYWTNRDGSAADFDWANGGSDNGLFGEPTVIGNTLQFSPSNFRAQSVDGASSIVSDRLQFDIIAHNEQPIQAIIITESGDYSITGTGKVYATGAMFVTNLDHYEVTSGVFDMDPDMPATEETVCSTWSGGITLTGFNSSSVRVVLNNNLMAFSTDGGISWIEKKDFGSGVNIEIIVPEPATVAFLILPAMIFTVKKRKH